MSDTTVRVFVEEEYGFRYWRWDTGMSAEELIAWWKALPSVQSYFFSPEGLPGTVIELGIDEDTPDEDAFDAFEAVKAETRAECAGWSAHVHMDDDSGLIGPQGRYRHAGYRATDFVAVPNDLQESE